MNDLSNRTVLHKRISNFVDWIAPDPSKVDDIKERMIRYNEYQEESQFKYVMLSKTRHGQ